MFNYHPMRIGPISKFLPSFRCPSLSVRGRRNSHRVPPEHQVCCCPAQGAPDISSISNSVAEVHGSRRTRGV